MTRATTPTSVPASAVGRPTDRAVWLRPALALDAVACAAIGAVLLVAPASLVDGFAITTATPLQLTGLALLVAAGVNAWAARADGRGPTSLAVGIDLAFAAVLAVLLVSLTSDVAGWARALVVAGIVVPAGYGVLKLVGLRHPAAGPARRWSRHR